MLAAAPHQRVVKLPLSLTSVPTSEGRNERNIQALLLCFSRTAKEAGRTGGLEFFLSVLDTCAKRVDERRASLFNHAVR